MPYCLVLVCSLTSDYSSCDIHSIHDLMCVFGAIQYRRPSQAWLCAQKNPADKEANPNQFIIDKLNELMTVSSHILEASYCLCLIAMTSGVCGHCGQIYTANRIAQDQWRVYSLRKAITALKRRKEVRQQQYYMYGELFS